MSIPDAETEGVRAYREPSEPRRLQLTFLDEAGEQKWQNEIRELLSGGRASEADVRLVAELEGFDGSLARLCKAIPVSQVEITGWEDLLPILEEWEGPPITCITVGLTNPADLVFGAGQAHEPELLIGLYSDEVYPFGNTGKADLLLECRRDTPAWIGAEEDVEFYCEISGLAALNTALIHSKHRHFLRDGRDGCEGRAPGGYVEYVLASWFLATRFLQALDRAVDRHRLPAGCRLIAGTVEVNADFICVLGCETPLTPAAQARAGVDQASIPALTVKPWVREDPAIDHVPNGSAIRQRLKPVEVEASPKQWTGFLKRLIGLFSRS